MPVLLRDGPDGGGVLSGQLQRQPADLPRQPLRPHQLGLRSARISSGTPARRTLLEHKPGSPEHKPSPEHGTVHSPLILMRGQGHMLPPSLYNRSSKF